MQPWSKSRSGRAETRAAAEAETEVGAAAEETEAAKNGKRKWG